MPSAIFDQFAVVVVPFPFSDRVAAKRRPALVVSSPRFNNSHPHRILAMITTTATAWPSDVPLNDLASAGLPKPSRLRLKVFTLDFSTIIRQIGQLSASDIRNVREMLTSALAV